MWVAVVSAVGTVGSAYLSSESSRKAANTQADAVNSANAIERDMYYQNREDTAPWRDTGAGAVNYLGHLLGVGPSISLPQVDKESFYKAATREAPTREAVAQEILQRTADNYGWESANTAYNQGELDYAIDKAYNKRYDYWLSKRPFDEKGYNNALADWNARNNELQKKYGEWQLLSPTEYQKSPEYNWQLQEGAKALDMSGAAKGQLRSGNQLKELTQFGQNLATADYDKYLQRYYNKLNPYLTMAGLGQVSAGQTANSATQYGTSAANNLLYQGGVSAQNQVNQGNIYGNALGNLANIGVNYSLNTNSPEVDPATLTTAQTANNTAWW